MQKIEPPRFSVNHKAMCILLCVAFFFFLLNLEQLIGLVVESLLK